MKSFYVTSPIYYVNDVPHIGHAYTSLACDVLARFMRFDGYRVHFLSGTDEHGQKVAKAAALAGVDPQAFTNKVSQNFRALLPALGCSNDDFIRTTEQRHKDSVQAIWRAMAARKTPKGNDNIYLGKYDGWYAVRDEAYYDESELTTGPDGKKRAPSGAEVEWVEEPSYFFRLSDWGDWLLEWYEKNPDAVGPATRRNEVMSFVKQGLHDLSISRTTFDWGIKVPGDEKHVMYVWLDALTNYITAVGYPNVEDEKFKTFWPASVHMVGKDIVRFHAVYWPAFLEAAGLAPAKRVYAHGWWTNEGQKISKSLGNVIDPLKLIETYGLDQVRYFLMREVPFGQDGDFSHAAMIRRMNTDLANDLGNLGQRVLSFVAKNAGACVPTPGDFTDADRAMLDKAAALLAIVRADMAQQGFHKALDAVFAVVADANRYVDAQAPWTLRKPDPARMATVLYVLMEILRRVALLLQPYMPTTMAKLLDQLAVPADARDATAWEKVLVAGTALPAPQGLFPRYVDPAAEAAKPGAGTKK
ncbi:MAG: methionine--tRNA ligase [Alphaproteobacteria bacterium]|nr:methionine--tRNA ligase [Alphaproteobacteria bacterium]